MLEPNELKALLKAAVTELGRLSGELTDGPHVREFDPELLGIARNSLATAVQYALEASKMSFAQVSHGPALQGFELEQVREAAAMRASALAERDAAEAQLRGVQRERTELLRRLKASAAERSQVREHRFRMSTEAAKKELQLEEECSVLEKEVEAARAEVKEKCRRIESRRRLQRNISTQRRSLEHRHKKTATEGEGAQEILFLQSSTEHYLKGMVEKRQELECGLNEKRREHEEEGQAQQLRFARLEEEHHSKIRELHNEMAELERDFQARWTEADAEARRKLEALQLHGDEEKQRLELDIQEAEEQLRTHAQVVLGQEERAQLHVEEAAQEELAVMEAQRQQRLAKLQEDSEAAQDHCAEALAFNQQRARELAKEVRVYRQQVEQIREGYALARRRLRKSRPASTSLNAGPYLALPAVLPAKG